MSKELWAIIGVVVGALATGGVGVLQAVLQRRWSAEDAERAWEREKQDRLFEAKRSAHAAFTEALHRGRALAARFDAGQETDETREDLFATMNELMHLQAQLQIYASHDAALAATDTFERLGEWALATREPRDAPAQHPGAFHTSNVAYIALMRADLGIEVSDLTFDDLMAHLEGAA